MQRWTSTPGDAGLAPGVLQAQLAARRGNRRRLLVFGSSFVVCLLLSQAWNLLRADEYQAGSRLQVSLPDAGLPGSSASSAAATQLQVLNSRPLLDKVARSLAAAGQALPAGPEPGAQLQAMLQVRPVPGADVLALRATGDNPALLAALLNALPDALRAELVASQAHAADAQLSRAHEELARLDKAAQQSRSQLERFRSQAGLQAERDDNEALARSKGLSLALNNAVEKEAAAQARLAAVTDSATAGRTGLRGREDATLVGLETRASQAREELRDMERSYTAAFMAMDPRARALRARLAELERQITQQRSASQQATQHAAEEELASARATVERLRGELAAARPTLRTVSTGFAQAKSLEDDVAQIDKARRELLERVARLEADQQRRVPTVTVLEAAMVPSAPFRPDRWRDGAMLLGGSLLLALLAMGLVELFNRPPVVAAAPGVTKVVLPAPWPGAAASPAGLAWAGNAPAALPLATPAAAAADGPALTAPPPPPPPLLQQAEAAALLAAAQGPARLMCAGALMGLSPSELLALRAGDLDATRSRLQVRGAWARELPCPAWLAPPAVAADALLLGDATGQGLDEADLKAWLGCAALDAGLPQGAGLTHEHLRNTCIAWLLGQGLRFSDLPALVGRIDAASVSAFAGHAADGPRRGPGQVTFLMPALQLDPAA